MISNVGWVMVVDGKEENQYESDEWRLEDIVFSPDSNHLAYIAGDKYRTPEHRHFIVLDGEESDVCKESSYYKLIFSQDGNRLAVGGNNFIRVDSVEEVVHSNLSIKSFVFSPDSTRYAYRDIKQAWLSDSGISAMWVVVDGVKGKQYKGVSDIAFSPDSKHVSYFARDGEYESIVVDDTRKEYEKVSPIVWDSSDRFHYLAWKSNNVYLVEETITQRDGD